MLKLITSCLCTFMMSFSMLFAAPQNNPNSGPPPRKDHLEYNTPYANMQLARAQRILGTLVSDPQSYQLVFSNLPYFGGEAFAPHVYSDKPTIIIYQGALTPDRSNEEIAFMMAHELGHLNLYHNERMDQQMEKIFTGPPIGISGTIMSIFFQKLQERQADLWGLNLYKSAGYNLNFFPYALRKMNSNPNMLGANRPFKKPPTSMSMKDAHFSMKERFTLLTQKVQNMA